MEETESKKGKCTNVGVCSKANSEEIQVITDPFAEFKCSECGNLLEEIKEEDINKNKGNIFKKLLIPVGILILIIVLSWVGFSLFKGKKKENKEANLTNQSAPQKKDTTITNNNTKVVVENTVKIEPGQNLPTSTNSNNQNTDKTQGNNNSTTIRTKLCDIPFPGGRYKGECKNGKPDGSGEYYYTERQLISKKDLKERYAEAGDYLIGESFEGNVTSGKLYDKDNHMKERIIIGR